jgi:hypothetical protein
MDEPELRARLVARRLLRLGLQQRAPVGPAQLPFVHGRHQLRIDRECRFCLIAVAQPT